MGALTATVSLGKPDIIGMAFIGKPYTTGASPNLSHSIYTASSVQPRSEHCAVTNRLGVRFSGYEAEVKGGHVR